MLLKIQSLKQKLPLELKPKKKVEIGIDADDSCIESLPPPMLPQPFTRAKVLIKPLVYSSKIKMTLLFKNYEKEDSFLSLSPFFF